tara:strand:- start:405 stop:767 length:363 start_codon:yes stop_codon:yes gene_type:complete
MSEEQPETINDILNQNDTLFKVNFIEGVSNQGLGLLIADMHERKSVFVPFEHIGYLNEHYGSDVLSDQVTTHFNQNPPSPDYMYIGIIINGELHIMSKPLNVEEELKNLQEQSNSLSSID